MIYAFFLERLRCRKLVLPIFSSQKINTIKKKSRTFKLLEWLRVHKTKSEVKSIAPNTKMGISDWDTQSGNQPPL